MKLEIGKLYWNYPYSNRDDVLLVKIDEIVNDNYIIAIAIVVLGNDLWSQGEIINILLAEKTEEL